MPLLKPLRQVGHRVRGLCAAPGALLVRGSLLCATALLAFALLALRVQDGTLQRMDEAVLLWLHAHRTERLDSWALKLTDLGSTTVVVMMVLVASAFLWLMHRRGSVLLLWVAMLGGAILNHTLKNAYARPRPELFERIYAGQPSFPSGHAMSVVVIYGTLAYLILRLDPPRSLRRLTLGVLALVVALVGLSRVYLGVHYPSDVLAGFAMGLAWATLCVLGGEVAARFQRGRSEAGQKA